MKKPKTKKKKKTGKKKNENIKRELARTASDDSKRWQRHLFNFDLVLFHLIRTVDTARRVDGGTVEKGAWGGTSFIYTLEK